MCSAARRHGGLSRRHDEPHHGPRGAGQAVWSQGRWEWTAPPGTTIVGGALAYRTRMRHPQFYARVKMRADGVTWDLAPTLVERAADDRADRSRLRAGRRLPADRRRALRAPRGGRLVTDAVGRLRHARAPRCHGRRPDAARRSAGSTAADCSTAAGTTAMSARRSAFADAQSGLGAVWLASGGVSSAGSRRRTGSQYQPGIAMRRSRRSASRRRRSATACTRACGRRPTRAADRRRRCLPVRIDATPPAARARLARGRRTRCAAGGELNVSDRATSGVASVLAQIDGATVPLDLAGGRGQRAAARRARLRRAHAGVVGRRRRGQPHRGRLRAFDVPDTDAARHSARRSRRMARRSPTATCSRVAVAVATPAPGSIPTSIAPDARRQRRRPRLAGRGRRHGVAARRLAAGAHHLVAHGRRSRRQRRAPRLGRDRRRRRRAPRRQCARGRRRVRAAGRRERHRALPGAVGAQAAAAVRAVVARIWAPGRAS